MHDNRDTGIVMIQAEFRCDSPVRESPTPNMLDGFWCYLRIRLIFNAFSSLQKFMLYVDFQLFFSKCT